MIKVWLEAMRLRTLPVSTAGVVMGVAMGLACGQFRVAATVLCAAVAIMAQIASNFGNEYYDFRDGLDRVGRDGPRRGVTEGDITPSAMLMATYVTLAMACLAGLVLIWLYGTWWMLVVGICVALGAMGYSAGPYPLSHHGLGEVAVILFFGVVPVTLTAMLEGTELSWSLLSVACGIGMMGANVLIVNNYRDRDDDMAVGKRTLAVAWGRRAMERFYLANGFVALLLTLPAWWGRPILQWLIPFAYLLLHCVLSIGLTSAKGTALNPYLGKTAVLMLAYAVAYLLVVVL